MSRARFISALAISLVAGCGRPEPKAPAKDPRMVELAKLMKDVINPVFSRLSFLTFHGSELGDEPQRAAAELRASAQALRRAIGQLRAWRYPPTSTIEGKDVFYTYAAAIDKLTDRLETEVSQSDNDAAGRSLQLIAETCNHCHHFFRLKIEDSVVGPTQAAAATPLVPLAAAPPAADPPDAEP